MIGAVRVCMLLAVVGPALTTAQTLPTVTISDTVMTPFGGTFSGRVSISLRYSGPLAAGSQTLVPGFIRLNVSNGALNVSLVPNSVINPPGTSYNVHYSSTNGFSWEETWVVPAYPPTTNIASVRVSTIPTPSVVIAPQQISTVGASPGQVLVYNGTSVSWASVGGGSGGAIWGSITGLLSNQQDLWSVLTSKANAAHTHSLSELTQSGASVGQVPVWNGTSWVPTNPPSSGDPGQHTHSASDIVSGLFAAERLGSGTANSSTFLRGDRTWTQVGWADVANKPSEFPPASHAHSAADITSGMIAAARLATGTPGSSNFLRGDQTWASVGWADVTGKPTSFPPSSHTHSADDIATGTIAPARLGAGTASATTFLRGDQQWAPVPVSSVFGRTGAVTASAGDYTASQITNSPAGNISATTVQAAINELDAEKAAVGHTHAAADITSGTIAAERLGTGTPGSSNFLRGDQTWSSVGWGDVTGKPTTFPPQSHTHSAADITSGTIATARLGAGTASSSTFLRGDQTWSSVGWADVTGKPTAFPPTNHSHLLTDLDSGGASTGQALVWNGTQWAPATISGGGGGGSSSATGYVMVLPATCQMGAASTGLVLPTSGYPTPVCIQGSNVTTAALDFADTESQSVQGQLILAGTVSSIDIQLKWRTTATSGSVVWQLQTACVADGETGDPTWNTAQLIVDAAKTTALQHNDAALSGVDLTGCASGKTMYWRLLRDPAHASDTINAAAQLLSILWVINR